MRSEAARKHQWKAYLSRHQGFHTRQFDEGAFSVVLIQGSPNYGPRTKSGLRRQFDNNKKYSIFVRKIY